MKRQIYTKPQKEEKEFCKRCHTLKDCGEIPFHGYSMILCEGCALAAYQTNEAV